MAVDYAALQQAVEDMVENTFTDVDFATLTRLAENKIYNSVQLPALRKNVTGDLSAGNQYLSTPGDFLSVYSLAVFPAAGGEYAFLLNKDVNFMRESFPNPASTGVPKYYALFGPVYNLPTELTFILGPTPIAGYKAELHYFYYPPSISTAGTSWVGDNFESVLINAIAVEAGRFMQQEADVMKMYQDQFNESFLLLKNLGDGKNRGDAYRNGQVRNPVK
jgi:hypothetical protein